MLISYTLDAGTNRHNLDTLSEIHLNHKTISFKDLVGSGKKKSDLNTTKTQTSKINTKGQESIINENSLDKWLKILNEQSVIAVDTETSSLNPLEADLVGVSFRYEPNKACYIPLAHKNIKSLKKNWYQKKLNQYQKIQV